MPIIVNMPGGGLDSAGQGVAAAQQYRANEQRMEQIDVEAMRRNEAFELDKQVALRGVQLRERESEFEMEQLAQQQEAEADVLLGQAIESGVDVGDQGAYREMLARTSPRFRQQMAAEFGRATRIKAEQQRFEAVQGELDLTPETKAKVESGELTDVGAIERSMAGERRKIAQAEEQESARMRALESWKKHTQDPLFDMPGKDDEAYGDVMDILGEIGPGAATSSKTNYDKLWNQLRLLTTKGMRDAARDLLQRDMGGVDIRGLPKGSMAAVAGGEEAQAIERRGRFAVGRVLRGFGVDGQKVKPDQTASALSATGSFAGAPPSGETPSTKLKQPLEETERAALYGAGLDADLQTDLRTALQDLGFDPQNPPRKGEPGYETVRGIVEYVTKKRAAERPEDIGAALEYARDLRPGVMDYAQKGLGAAMKALTPTEEEVMRNRAAARKGRGVREDSIDRNAQERRRIQQALSDAGLDADAESDVLALMQQLGLKEIPQAGTPEYAQLSAALKALKEKRAAEKPKASIGAPLREGRGGKFL